MALLLARRKIPSSNAQVHAGRWEMRWSCRSTGCAAASSGWSASVEFAVRAEAGVRLARDRYDPFVPADVRASASSRSTSTSCWRSLTTSRFTRHCCPRRRTCRRLQQNEARRYLINTARGHRRRTGAGAGARRGPTRRRRSDDAAGTAGRLRSSAERTSSSRRTRASTRKVATGASAQSGRGRGVLHREGAEKPGQPGRFE